MPTPSFDIKILVEKVCIVREYLGYVCARKGPMNHRVGAPGGPGVVTWKFKLSFARSEGPEAKFLGGATVSRIGLMESRLHCCRGGHPPPCLATPPPM